MQVYHIVKADSPRGDAHVEYFQEHIRLKHSKCLPGATQLTLIPSGPSSCANAFVSATSAVLLMAYLHHISGSHDADTSHGMQYLERQGLCNGHLQLILTTGMLSGLTQDSESDRRTGCRKSVSVSKVRPAGELTLLWEPPGGMLCMRIYKSLSCPANTVTPCEALHLAVHMLIHCLETIQC